MAFREALLTLLSIGPRHGYQLKLDFEAATGEAWPLNIGQVYSTLQRLERDGLIEHVDTDADDRIVYRVTGPGAELVAEWLSRPVARSVTNRDELSMKLLLALAAGVADPETVIATQRGATMTALQDYTRLREETDEHELAWELLLDRLIIRADAELRWLDRVEERLANRPDTVGVPTGETDPVPDPEALTSGEPT